VYYVFNKPRDVVTTCLSGKDDEQGIMDIVNISERVFPIGRLDKETTGLIILAMSMRRSMSSRSMVKSRMRRWIV
jgi:16S rRNA U516 pseudouridylate synthase RsuA-like enzyme